MLLCGDGMQLVAAKQQRLIAGQALGAGVQLLLLLSRCACIACLGVEQSATRLQHAYQWTLPADVVGSSAAMQVLL